MKQNIFSFQFDKQNDVLAHYVQNDYKWSLHKVLVEEYGFENMIWRPLMQGQNNSTVSIAPLLPPHHKNSKNVNA